MASQRRNRERRPARRAPHLDPKRRLLVVCEGEVTEPSYLRGYERHVRNATVEIDIPKERGVPLTLVREAKTRKDLAAREGKKDPNAAYDEVWCVFDVDEHPHLPEAKQLAKDNGIQLAISNPCFELWLILHFRENPGCQHRHDIQKMLGDHLPGYDKHLKFEDVATGVDGACQRANRLNQDAASMGEEGRNPSTGVVALIESIASV